MVTEQQFLKEVKKIFPNATLDSISNKHYIKEPNWCWIYGEISTTNYPDKYHSQIRKINKMNLSRRK